MKRKTTQQNLRHLTIEERHQVKQQFFRLYKKNGNVAANARALDISPRSSCTYRKRLSPLPRLWKRLFRCGIEKGCERVLCGIFATTVSGS